MAEITARPGNCHGGQVAWRCAGPLESTTACNGTSCPIAGSVDLHPKLKLLLGGRLLAAGAVLLLGVPAIYIGLSFRDAATLACGMSCMLAGVSWTLQPRVLVWPFGEDLQQKLKQAQVLQQEARIGSRVVMPQITILGYLFAGLGTLFGIARLY